MAQFSDPKFTSGLRTYLVSQGFKSDEIDSVIRKRAVAEDPGYYQKVGLKPEAIIEAAGGIGSVGGLQAAQYLGANQEAEVPELGEQERKFVVGYAAALKARKLLEQGVKTGPKETIKSKAKELANQPDEGASLRAQLSLAQTGIKSAFLGTAQSDMEMRSLADAISNPMLLPSNSMKKRLDNLISTIQVIIDPNVKKYAEDIVRETGTDTTVGDMEVNSLLQSINQQKQGLGATPSLFPQAQAQGGLPPTPETLETESLLSEAPEPSLADIIIGQPTPTPKKKEPTLSELQKPEESTFEYMLRQENLPHPAEAIANMPGSAKNVFLGFADAITHPIRTTEAMIGTVAGGVEKLIPGEQRGEKFFDAYAQYLKGRYGNPDDFYRTFVEDPFGTMLDVVSVIDLGATSLKSLAGTKLDDVAKAATIVDNAVVKADIVDQGIRGARYVQNKTPAQITLGIPGVSKNFKPEVARLADELDVPLPASALTESRIVRNAEAVAQNTVLSGQRVSARVLASEKRLAELGDDLVNKYTTATPDTLTGQVIKEGYEAYVEQFKDTKNQLYDNIPPASRQAVVTPEETLKTLQGIVDEKRAVAGGGTNLKFYQTKLKTMKKAVEEDKYTVKNMLADKRDIGARISESKRGAGVMTGDTGQLGRLEASIMQDLDTSLTQLSPDFGRALNTANAYYARTIKKVNSSIGKTVAKSNPERIVQNIFKPNSATDIMLFKELVGDEGFKVASQAFFQKIMAESLNKQGAVDYAKLSKNMRRYGHQTLLEGLGPELTNRLTQLSEQAQKLAVLEKAFKDGQIPAIGSRTAFLQNVNKYMYALGGLNVFYKFNPMFLMSAIASDLSLGVLLGTKWGRTLMTQGMKIKLPKAMTAKGLEWLQPMGRRTRIPETVNLQLEQNQQQELPAVPPALQ
jgi:hypothetical protein